jgi:hypothetical protein
LPVTLSLDAAPRAGTMQRYWSFGSVKMLPPPQVNLVGADVAAHEQKLISQVTTVSDLQARHEALKHLTACLRSL